MSIRNKKTILIKKDTPKRIYKTTEEIRVITDISKYKGKHNLVTFLVTTDFRFQKRNNRLTNDIWDLDFISKELVYPNKCVDFMHIKNKYRSKYI
jgi:hypothetical protein